MKIILVLVIIGAIFIVLQITGLLDMVINAFTELWNAIVNFFSGLIP